MKKIALWLGLPLLACGQTAVGVGGQIGNFHFAVSNYYHVPEREVLVLRERRLRDEDLPVALFLAQQARVAPATIVNLRLGGKSWWDIAVQYRISPEVFYVPVAAAPGPPYGKAWGHYKNKHRQQWRTIVLDDDDIVTLVNVKFLAGYHHTTPDRIIALRPQYGNFVAIHTEVGRGRQVEVVAERGGGESRGKGRGKGKGHER